MSQVAEPAAPAATPAPAPAAAAPAPAKPEPVKGDSLSALPEPKPASAAADAAVATAPVVPEKYDLKAPEGQTLNAGLVKEWTPVFKDAKLTNEQAQKLADSEIARQAAATEAMANEHAGWIKTNKADAEIGGAKYQETLRLAASAEAWVEKSVPGFTGLLKAMRIEDQPIVMKALRLIGKALAEDSTAGIGSAQVTEKRAADVLFGQQNKPAS